MNHDEKNQDGDLRDAFRQLREVDAGAVRGFEASRGTRGSWHLRRGVAGGGVLAIALIAGLLVLFVPSPKPDSGTTTDLSGSEIDIPFDDYSKMIEEEMKLVALSEWRSPTGFLLQPEPELTKPNDDDETTNL